MEIIEEEILMSKIGKKLPKYGSLCYENKLTPFYHIEIFHN